MVEEGSVKELKSGQLTRDYYKYTDGCCAPSGASTLEKGGVDHVIFIWHKSIRKGFKAESWYCCIARAGPRSRSNNLTSISRRFAAIPKNSRTNYTTKRLKLHHSLVSLITALINIYTVQGGHYSITVKIIVIIFNLYTGNVSVIYFLGTTIRV